MFHYEKGVSMYYESGVPHKAYVLYFHGGGLLYGTRKDLPERHLREMTGAGYIILAMDYPLAPAAGIQEILEDVVGTIEKFPEWPEIAQLSALPYFLLGRSAGAYLCLLAAASGRLTRNPAGILSFYGFGFLCGGWFESPNPMYCALPAVEREQLKTEAVDAETEGAVETHFARYVYSRQNGDWIKLLYSGDTQEFLARYSLRGRTINVPVFCAHSIMDPDVPFEEFKALSRMCGAERFLVYSDVHDFDRLNNTDETGQLLKAAIRFLDDRMIDTIIQKE